jgi:hypothetical protein
MRTRLFEHLAEADAIEVIEAGMTLSRDGLLPLELERTEAARSDFLS